MQPHLLAEVSCAFTSGFDIQPFHNLGIAGFRALQCSWRWRSLIRRLPRRATATPVTTIFTIFQVRIA